MVIKVGSEIPLKYRVYLSNFEQLERARKLGLTIYEGRYGGKFCDSRDEGKRDKDIGCFGFRR